uniref:Endonuclease/exonuclease/phosphatase domain-containing protein n=1 Tax=Ananas comosus var. bracteatus TaxID=296719 RepID=A0A6V7PKZ7_ANACO|nr:unnamed protein product [Ananas comosus var. bracteatus]
MVEDRCFSVPIEIESVEEANPILLGENLDEHLDLVSVEAQERFIRQTGFTSVPAYRDYGSSTAPWLGAPSADGGELQTGLADSPLHSASPPNFVTPSGEIDARLHRCATAYENFSIFRSSLRLAAKNRENKKSTMQKAQELRCKKIRVTTPALKLPCTRLNSGLSEIQAEVDPGISGSNAGKDRISGSNVGKVFATPPKCDMAGLHSASPQKRDTTHPLTPEEIQLIKTVCGISDIDVDAVPACLIAAARINGATSTGVNRIFRFLTWNVRGLNDLSKCAVVKSFIRHCKCCVVCFQETKLSSTSNTKFRSFSGFHLLDFRTLNAEGTRGGFLTAWNPSLFECTQEWAGRFSLTVVLKRIVDGNLFTITNVYGPTAAILRADFFHKIRAIGELSTGAWTVLGDFNVLLSVQDKNGPTANVTDILNFREVVHELGLVDLPLLNKSFTWSNGRGASTLERLDRAFISSTWLIAFPRSTLRALPRPRSDHTPLVLSAYTFIPHANLFRFESYWLRHPAVFDVVSTAWNSNSNLTDSDPVSLFSLKIISVQSALQSWSASLSSATREQTKLCLLWIEWLDKAEEERLLSNMERNLRPKLKARYEDLCLQEEIKWKQRSRVHWLKFNKFLSLVLPK